MNLFSLLNPATTMVTESVLLSLPPELIEQILLNLHPLEIVQCRQVRFVDSINCKALIGFTHTHSLARILAQLDLQSIKATD
jgi:hypothetical protein